ncbi:MAG: hypothetical protein MJZ73_01580 [Bacteroidaceae bacterium]|nr:hypothetical protein [Bacteroidaceae bacterium]
MSNFLWIKICILILIISIVIPIIVNIICLIPSHHAGTASDWIAFFGNLFGTMFTIGGSFWVFFSTYKKDQAIKKYEIKQTKIEALTNDVCERIPRLHLKEFSSIALEIQKNGTKQLNEDQVKLIFDSYFKFISDKKTFEIKYGDDNGQKAEDFRKLYLNYIDSIITLCGYLILQSNQKNVDYKDLLFLSSIKENDIINLFIRADAWVHERIEKNEKFKNENYI